ncbi:alpha/beta-hydrolase [Trametopsis cervina]|nr:alpha/beta-hydrolase [Trametopsis cervina]
MSTLPSTSEFLNVSYTSDVDSTYHSFDLYTPSIIPDEIASPPLLIFVHGGAWRAEDKKDYGSLARRLVSLTGYPVAVPNYRLTTAQNKLQHPAHTEDLLAFLHFIIDWTGPSGVRPPYNPTSIYAIGHSCSAHMLTAIFLEPTPDHAPAPSLIPSPRLLSSVKKFVLSSGLYDLDLLLQSFPGYKDWFIASTFGDYESYSRWTTANMRLREELKDAKWLIIHSRGDTLVDTLQSETMLASLQAQGAVVSFDTQLTEDHNDTLRGDTYPGIVSQFVLS